MKNKLELFTFKDLQNFNSLISFFKKNGMYTIDKIEKFISEEQIKRNEGIKRYLIKKQKVNSKFCPSCKKSHMFEYSLGDELFYVCKKCRYSEYIGEK